MLLLYQPQEPKGLTESPVAEKVERVSEDNDMVNIQYILVRKVIKRK